MKEVFLKRDELVLKHKQLSSTLKIQKDIKLSERVKATQKELKKIERQYAKIQNQIEDYYYSLSDEEADEIVKPNTEDIMDMYVYTTKKTKRIGNELTKENDENVLKEINDIAKEISKLF